MEMIYLSKILVIGPLAIDQWVVTKQLPNPDGNYIALRRVLSPNGFTSMAGCAGSVAVNLARLNNEVVLLSHSSDFPSLFSDWNLNELNYLSISLAQDDKTFRLSSTKFRYLNESLVPILRVDFPSNTKPLLLNDFIAAIEQHRPDAVYIADYEASELEGGIASAKILGYFCDWLLDNYKGITISDSRRVVYNTHIVKTNASEWEQIQQKKAWHKDQYFIRSAGRYGVRIAHTFDSQPSVLYETRSIYDQHRTVSTCGAGDVVTSVFLDRDLRGCDFKTCAEQAHLWASEATTRPYTCRVSLKAAL